MSYSIVIIDPDQGSAQTTAARFQRRWGQNVQVNIVRQADWASVQAHSPNLVVIDPDPFRLHGLRLLEQLCEEQPSTAIAVVASGSSPSMRQRLRNLPITSYLEKPSSLAPLLGELDHLVESNAALQSKGGLVMERQLLIPLDGSLLAEQALDYAVVLARRNSSVLHLVRVVGYPPLVPAYEWPVPSAVDSRQWLADERQAAQTYLDELKARYEQQGLAVRTTILDGEPAHAIIQFATEQTSVREIVLASHGRSGLGRWVLGSVAEKLVQATPVPILVIHGDERKVETFKIPPELRTIIVPLDGSAIAEQALPLASQLAEAHSAELVLLSVTPGIDDPGLIESGLVPMWSAGEKAQAREQAQKYLEQLEQSLQTPRLRLRHLVVSGTPAEMIDEIAQETVASMIVMATHGRSGFSRMWMGSVATKLIRSSQRPIFLVRAVEQAAERGQPL